MLSLLLAFALLLPLGEVGHAAEPVGKLFRRGKSLLRNGKPGEAEALWKEVVRREPTHFNARLALGKFYLARNPAAALEQLQIARNLRPGSDAAHYHLGRYFESRKQLEEAAESYRRAIHLNARNYNANRRLRVVIRALRGRKTVVERAADQFWSNPSLAALTLYGRLVMQEAEPRRALWEFEVLRDRLPKLPEVNLWIARAQRQLGSLQGEIEAYRAFLGGNPAAAGVWLLMLERLLDAGEYRQAEGPLRELDGRSRQKRIRPRQVARFQFLKGRFLSVQGRPDEAGELLLAAGMGGYDGERVGAAFASNVALYPGAGSLWLSYARWLKAVPANDSAAVSAFLKAGKLEPSLAGLAEMALLEIVGAGTARVSANLALGELALAGGNEEQAVARLREIPPGHKADLRASLLLGKIYRARGDLELALRAFTRYVFSFPDREGMIFARGNLFWEIGQKEVAAAVWGKNLAALRAHPEALALMAEHLRAAGAEAQQEIDVRRALSEATPENVPNRLRLGDLLASLKRPAEAAEQWAEAAKYKPGDFALLARIGKYYLDLGDTARGTAALLKAARIGTLDARLAERLARQMLVQEQYEQALVFYWQIYLQEPNHPDLERVLPLLVVNTAASPEQRVAAAHLAEKSGRTELAIDLLEELIRRKTATGDSRVMLAGLYLMNSEIEEAERVIRGDSGREALGGRRALEILAEAQRRLEKKDELAETLYGIAKLDPGDQGVSRELGLLLAELNRLKEAYRFLKRAVAGETGNPRLLLLFSKSAFGKQEYEETLATLNRLAALDPGNGEARALRTRVLQQTQRWDELAVFLERVVAERPADAAARHHLISAYLNRFEKEKARVHFEVLRKLDPPRARLLRRYFKQRRAKKN